jgi:hypothetical protein
MSTWLDDLKKSDPKLAHAYGVVGNQDRTCLRNMVSALSSLTILNTREDNERLAAARYILAKPKNRR